MKILTEEEMVAKLDFRRPLASPPDEPQSVWCIPFEYGANPKGTRISIAKAKEISAELRAAVAEAEKRSLREAFDQEKSRNESLSKQLAETDGATDKLMTEINELKQKLHRARKRQFKR